MLLWISHNERPGIYAGEADAGDDRDGGSEDGDKAVD